MFNLENHYIADTLKKLCGLLENNEQIVIAVDGMSGALKSTMAQALAKKYEAQIIHCDDFFLPAHLRSKERYEQPGGNIDYVRLKDEVIDNLSRNSPQIADFSYGKFDCRQMKVTQNINISKARMYVVEGVYSLHPYFGKYYDYSIFLKVNGKEQLKRIEARNGDVQMFKDMWIPMENLYFDKFAIQQKADCVIDTTLFLRNGD